MSSEDSLPEATELQTEQVSPRYTDLDRWPAVETIAAMYEAQLSAAAAVREVLGEIASAVEEAAPALLRGGRLIYIGAGTSARIAVQDGAELGPTFDWPAERVVFLIAGGTDALVRSVEGAEDSETRGAQDAADARVGPNDIAVAVAASGTTPYTLGALKTAQAARAVTIAVTSNAQAPLLEFARHRIVVKTGAEVIAGSTRMKAGTAQKIVLNLFSTALMVKLGRIYCGLMVQLQVRNAKLRRRAEAIVAGLTGCRPVEARDHLDTANGDLKLAVLLAKGVAPEDATLALEKSGGNLRSALDALVRPGEQGA